MPNWSQIATTNSGDVLLAQPLLPMRSLRRRALSFRPRGRRESMVETWAL